MHIGIIGIGKVGSALGVRWVNAGHQITFCVRDPDNLEKRSKADQMKAGIAPMSSVSQADVVLLAVPWKSVEDAVRAAGDMAGRAAGDMAGKIVLDCTNPLNNDLTELMIGHETSGGENVAQLVPQVRVVKIFNTNGSKNMEDSDYGDHKVTMFYAGNDAVANQVAAMLAAEIGFEPIELGGLKESRLLEPLAMAWITLSKHRGFGRDFALDVVRRNH